MPLARPSSIVRSGSLGTIPPGGCPAGTHQTCMLPAPGAAPGSAPCVCTNNPPVLTQAATVANQNWGLYTGIGIAAFIVFKVATR
jgi:hypothetical protein